MSTGAGTPDERRYRDELERYEAARGTAANNEWRALLRVLTADQWVWERVGDLLDYARGRVDLDEARGLSTTEGLLVGIGLALFRGRGTVELSDLALLDAPTFEAVVDALRLYRGEGG